MSKKYKRPRYIKAKNITANYDMYWDTVDEVVIKDRAPAGTVAHDHSEVQRLEALIARTRTAKQGWTDVARLTERGAVAVNYGPGEVAQAHQVNESIPISNMDVAYGVLREFLNGR